MPHGHTKLALPKFSSEAEEAKWWDSHHELVEETLLEAIKKGKAKQGMAVNLTRERLEPRKQPPKPARTRARIRLQNCFENSQVVWPGGRSGIGRRIQGELLIKWQGGPGVSILERRLNPVIPMA